MQKRNELLNPNKSHTILSIDENKGFVITGTIAIDICKYNKCVCRLCEIEPEKCALNVIRIITDNDIPFNISKDTVNFLTYTTEYSRDISDHNLTFDLCDDEGNQTQFRVNRCLGVDILPTILFEGKHKGDIIEFKYHGDEDGCIVRGTEMKGSYEVGYYGESVDVYMDVTISAYITDESNHEFADHNFCLYCQLLSQEQ